MFHLNNIQTAYDFINELKNASLNSGQLDPDDIDQLWNPPNGPVDLADDPDFRLSLDLFLSITNTSQEVYNNVRNAIVKQHPEDPILSYDQVKCYIMNLTGIIPLTDDMCINSCMVYSYCLVCLTLPSPLQVFFRLGYFKFIQVTELAVSPSSICYIVFL
jgi:hypothetical protein